MIFPKTPKPPADSQGGPESMLPGHRSGEGSDDIFKQIERDIRRKAGLPGRRKPEDKKLPDDHKGSARA